MASDNRPHRAPHRDAAAPADRALPTTSERPAESPVESSDTANNAGAPPRRGARREALRAWAISIALTASIGALGRAVPLVQANLVALVAAVFFFVPRWTLPGGVDDIHRYGWHTQRAAKSLAAGLALSALTFAFFVPGFHVWLTHGQPALAALVGQEAPAWERDVHFGAYRRLPDRWFGTPAALQPGAVHVFHTGERIFVDWTPDTPASWSLIVETDGQLLVHRRLDSPERSRWERQGRGQQRVSMSFATRGAHRFEVRAQHGQRPLPADAYRLGAMARPASDARLEDGALALPLHHAWLAHLLLTQLLLIAFAEEFFYRGYLQKRWAEGRPSRVAFRLGPLAVSRTNVAVSALFALGHLTIEPSLGRLAVFFPSLLFGALRDRHDSLAGGVVYHAACNVMVQLVALHYY